MTRRRIFIVEDERVVAMDLERRLTRLGHDVVGNVPSAAEALEEVGKTNPDILMADIKLDSNMDGVELARVLHKRYGIAVVFVTAYSDEDTLNRVKGSDACGFILKPFTDQELQATIDIGMHEHEMEVKLRQSEEQYRRLFNEAPVGYHEINLEGRIVRVNQTELDMLLYMEKEVLGKPVWHFLLEGEAVRDHILQKIHKDEFSPHPFERNYLRSDSRVINVLVKDYPIRDENGKLQGVRSTIPGITLLKEEQAKRASFFDIVEKSSIGLLVVSREGYVRYVNPAGESLLGLREDTLIGEKFGIPSEFEHKELELALGDGKTGIGEVRVVSTTWDEEPAYLVSVYDITERKKVERELKKIDEMKTDFISIVSHELRTPLSISKEGLSLVLDRVAGEINEKQSVILSAAKNNMDRLARIIDILLDISKIEAGKMKLKKEMVDVVEIVNQVVAGFKLRAKDKNIALRTEFSANSIKLFADHDKLHQIFTNLVNNALKFTEKGYILLAAHELDGKVECKVADSGIGISPKNLSRVFVKFEQFTRNAGPGERGAGLGLSIVKRLVEMHHGRISVASELGKGTTFTFVLPKSKSNSSIVRKKDAG
jgi:PAS domain S-box-containing protein